MMSDTTQHNKEIFLRASEAAKLLRVHRRTVWRMIARGQLEGTKVAGSWRVQRSDIEALLPGGAA
jgi:excisionase family DNA binding protein